MTVEQHVADPMEPINAAAAAFDERLKAIRAKVPKPGGHAWYPWSTSITNLWLFSQVLTGEHRKLFSDMRGRRVADIGGADGDMAFFMESLGATADLIDHPATSNNALMGARTFKEHLQSLVTIHEIDVDTQFAIPATYDLVMLLGILYHLKNPYYALEALGKATSRLLISTKVTAYSAPVGHPDRVPLKGPLAYLLATGQCNNDPTNYWVFTEEGLRMLITRTGWHVADYKIFGPAHLANPLDDSDPYTLEGDRRMFCYLTR